MAFGTRVQSAQGTGASGNASATLGATATVGNLLLFMVARSTAHGSGGAWGSPGDGFTLLHDSGVNTGNMGAAWWWKVSEGDETAVSVAGTNESGNWRAVIEEFEGPFHATTPFDTAVEDAGNIGTVVTSQPTGTTGTTAQANALAVAFIAADSAVNVDGGRSFSNSFTENTFASDSVSAARVAVIVASRVLSATGTYSTTFTTTDTGDEMYGSIAIFRGEAPDNDPPVVVLDTADETAFTTNRPTLLFTGTDPEADDIRYQIQIANNSAFAGGGVNMTFEHVAGSGQVHPNPTGGTVSNGTSADGNPQVDDRPGETITMGGGVLDKIACFIGRDETDTDGDALIRFYDIEGTPGTDAAPAGESGGSATPTAGWLAASDAVPFDNTAEETYTWYEFPFTGAQRVQTISNSVRMAIVDWIPVATSPSSNTIAIATGNVAGGHNGWIDGNSANYGVQAFGPHIRVYELQTLVDATSGTDDGFDNGADTDPFTSGEQVSFEVQAGDELADGTWYWRVRGIDPDGSGGFGDWTAARSFTVDTSGGIIQAIGQATETDIAQPITRVKAAAVAQTTETDNAQQVTRLKAAPVNTVNEQDAGQPITASKTAVVGQVSETDIAQAITSGAAILLGQASETDQAQAVARLKTSTLALINETDQAQAIGRIKVLEVGQVSEVDAAQPVTAVRIVAIGQVSEADIAQALSRLKTAVVGQASETDQAIAIILQGGAVAGLMVIVFAARQPGVTFATSPPHITFSNE